MRKNSSFSFYSVVSDEGTDVDNPISKQYKDIYVEIEDNDGEVKDMNESERNNEFFTYINITKNILGGGPISLPFVFKTLGIIPAIFVIYTLALLNQFSTICLLKCKDMTKRYGYSIYAKITLGNKGTLLLKLCLILSTFGSCCYYFKIFGELLYSLLNIFIKNVNELWFLQPKILIIGFWVCISPLAFKKNISELTITNFIGVFSIIILMISLVSLFLYKLYIEHSLQTINDIDIYYNKDLNLFQQIVGFSGLIDTFVYQHNFFPLYLTLKNRNSHKMKKLGLFSVLTVCIVDIFTGIIGYFMYGKKIDNVIIDILKNELVKYVNQKQYFLSGLLFLLISSFLISALLTIPSVFFSTKLNFINLVLGLHRLFTDQYHHVNLKKSIDSNSNVQKDSLGSNIKEEYKELGEELNDMKDKDNIDDDDDEYEGIKIKHKKLGRVNPRKFSFSEKQEEKNPFIVFILTLLFYCLTLYVTLQVDKLINISIAIGATVSNAITLIFPPLFYIMLSKHHFGKKLFLPWLVILIGFLFMGVYIYNYFFL